MIKIVMCTYNGEKYIAEQIDSLFDNDFKDWELIISDDRSMDGTISIAENYRLRYQGRIKININKERKGVVENFLSAAYKAAENITDSDYVMFCDQDDVWNCDKISKTLKGMIELGSDYGNNIPLLVCTDACVADDRLNVINESFMKMNHYNINRMDMPHLMMENKVQGCTVMINRRLARMLDRLPVNATMHDAWLALIAAAFGKIKYIDEPTMKYRQHGNNVQGSVGYKEDIRNKFLNLGAQRQIVMDTVPQIAEFLEMYGAQLSSQTQNEATAFATLPQQGLWLRRYNIIKYHMWKSGVFRNVGLMMLI